MFKPRKRFSVRKVKCCYRYSMIAGNPIWKSWEQFGVYDKDWKYDKFSGLSAFNNVLFNPHNSGKFRKLYETEEEALKAAEEMNRIWNDCGKPDMIQFSQWGDVKLEKLEMKCPWKI